MRELRVEDALMYLDQVKMEFGDRPHIYNEFLEIMKTFKSQQIDTPGVIRRVSSLFHGNRKLVLGFNTFLPEGYKIEIPVDENTGQAYTVFRTPGQPGVTFVRPPGPPGPTPPPSILNALNNGQSPSSQPASSSSNNQGPPPPGNSGGMPPQRPMSAQSQQQQQQQQSQTSQQQVVPMHNLPTPLYMQRNQNPSQPTAVQQQQQQQHFQMSQPHAGGGMSLSGNGTSVNASTGVGTNPSMAMNVMRGKQQQPHPSGIGGRQISDTKMGSPPSNMTNTNGTPQSMYSQPSSTPQQQQQQQQPPQQQPVEFDHAINYVTTIKKRFASQPDTYKKFLEILHTYQKEQRGIKEVLDEVSILFADHPDLLRDFTYFLPDAVQEQAKHQLEEVVRIAENRKRAKEAKEGSSMMISPLSGGGGVVGGVGHHTNKGVRGVNQQPTSSMLSPLGSTLQPPPPSSSSKSNVLANNVVAMSQQSQVITVPFGAQQGRTEEREREICRSAIYGFVSFEPCRPPRKNTLPPAVTALKYGRPRTIPEQPVQPTTKEAAFFERVRKHLNRKELGPDKPPGSRRHTPHAEFLKCLHLFACGVLNKEELLLLIKGLFMQGHAPKSGCNAGGGNANPVLRASAEELMMEFMDLLVHRGPYATQKNIGVDKSKYGSVTQREFDVSTCEQVTPSYHMYPGDYPHEMFHSHAGQTAQDAAVLNNTLFSYGKERSSPSTRIRLLHSPEDYDGMRIRRNVYEDAMAKLEDDRFEMDMAIERNNHAMRQVEPLAEEVSRLRESEENDGQPIGRMHYKLRPRSLNCNHLGAIARLYGDSGDEVLHHLLRNPVAVLPIVFKRLREKDTEWKKERTDMIVRWRAIAESNYEGTLDTLCYFYRREIEKSFSHNQLIDVCKRAVDIASHPNEQNRHPAVETLSPSVASSNNNEKVLMFQPHLSVKVKRIIPHQDAYDCISTRMMSVIKTASDREKVSRVWTEFITPWFDLPAHTFLKELHDKSKSDKSSCIVRYAAGQLVRTAFGDGKLVDALDGDDTASFRYKVELPFGVGFLRPSAIAHIIPSSDTCQYMREDGVMKPLELNIDTIENSPRLEPGSRLLFATEKIYIFLRLYLLMITILNNAKDQLTALKDEIQLENTPSKSDSDDAMIVDDNASETKPNRDTDYHGYYGLIRLLKDYILEEDVEFKTFETLCRSITREKVHEVATLPKLVEKCADALLKVVREDLLLPLFDLCQINDICPISQRSHSLAVSKEACYRIQFKPLTISDIEEDEIYFSYLPKESELLTSPPAPVGDDKSIDSQAQTENNSSLSKEENNNGDMDVEEDANPADDDSSQHLNKRMRVK